ncbi:MAG: TM1802 family CRISPR-associated protein [Petrimonas sp.]|nr:TM1802 family CRISPR-associated protein [Petrimonas sp.]
MLNTLIALGKQVSQQQNEWNKFVEIPKFEEKTNSGVNITNYVLVVTFDIDNKSVHFKDGLRSFSVNESPKKYRNINSELWGRNGAPWMVTCSYPQKLNILQKSIFGKSNKNTGQGLFLKSILKSYPEAKDTLFCKALEACYSLRDIIIDEEKKGIELLDNKYISKKIPLSKNHKIVMLSIAIKDKSLGIKEPTLLSQLEGYDLYVKKNFHKNTINEEYSTESLCYITGKKSNKIISPSFSDREDLNKLFVTTTINYANNFDNKSFKNNYQLDADINDALQNGSNYIRGKLNNQRCSIRIANTEHFIIPVFLDPTNIDIKNELDYIQAMNEWIFSTRQLENTFTSLGMESGSDLYWISYVAYDSDGNSVKLINHIKDISNTWLCNIIERNIEQSTLISNYTGQRRCNLSTVYFAIPVRKDHEKKNDVLKLISQILEQRVIKREKLFSYFIELILCHYYGRYFSYSNITFKPDSFDIAIRDSVVKYLFLFNLLKSLNLMDMEESEIKIQETLETGENQRKLQQFFTEMGYSEQQQALYWLGRMIWKIGSAQYNKQHKQKPILNKINYNGMDYSKIQKLYVDVFELATHYNIVNDINYYSKEFSQKFPAEGKLWLLSPQESVFYILSGYSLYIDNK